jgi:hypothetical protein
VGTEDDGSSRTWCGNCLTWTETRIRELIDGEFAAICAHCGRLKKGEIDEL